MSNTTIVLTGDDANLFKAYQRAIQQAAKLDGAVQSNDRNGRKAKSGMEALGKVDPKGLIEGLHRASAAAKTTEMSVSNVARDAKTLGGLSFNWDVGNALSVTSAVDAAIQLATASWSAYSQARSEALRSQEGIADENRRLGQVATDSEDLAALQSRADRASAATGVSREVTRDVLFSARSEGFEKDYEAIIAANQVVDPKASAVVAGQLPSLFGGKVQPLEAVSLTLAAAKESRLDFESVAKSLPGAAEGAAVLGSSPQELTATLSVLASRFKSGDVAADRIKAFSSTAGIDDRFKGTGIIQTLDTLQKMPTEERTEFLGKSQEMNIAFQILSEERPKIEAQIAKMLREKEEFAAGRGTLREQQTIVRTNPTVQNLEMVNIARVREEIKKEESLGTEAAKSEAAKMDSSALAEDRNAGMLDRFVTSSTSKALDVVDSVFGLKMDAATKSIVSNATGELTSKRLGRLGAPNVNEGIDSLNSNTARTFLSSETEKAESRKAIGLPPTSTFTSKNAPSIETSRIPTSAMTLPIPVADVQPPSDNAPAIVTTESRIPTSANTTPSRPDDGQRELVADVQTPRDNAPAIVTSKMTTASPIVATSSVTDVQRGMAPTFSETNRIPTPAIALPTSVTDVQSEIVPTYYDTNRIPTPPLFTPTERIRPDSQTTERRETATTPPTQDSTVLLMELRSELQAQNELVKQQNAILRDSRPENRPNPPPNPALIIPQQSLRGN